MAKFLIYCDTRVEARKEAKRINGMKYIIAAKVKGDERIDNPKAKVVHSPTGISGSREYCGHTCNWGVEVN